MIINQEKIEALAAVADKARTLLADIKARYPGEALRCPHMQGLDQAVSRLETCRGTEGHIAIKREPVVRAAEAIMKSECYAPRGTSDGNEHWAYSCKRLLKQAADALAAARPTPEEHERGIEAAIREMERRLGYTFNRGRTNGWAVAVRAIISAYLAATGDGNG